MKSAVEQEQARNSGKVCSQNSPIRFMGSLYFPVKKYMDSVEKNASYCLCSTLSFTSRSAPNLHKQVSQAEPSGSKGLGLNGVRTFSLPGSEMLRSGQQNTGVRFNIL